MTSPIFAKSVQDAPSLRLSRLALVAMPWSGLVRPSTALGPLAPYLRQQIPGAHVECFPEFVTVGTRLGKAIYEELAESVDEAELLYAPQLYPEKLRDVEQQFRTWWTVKNHPVIAPIAWKLLQCVLPEHVEETARRLVDERFDAVAMTMGRGQLFANLALARRVKTLAPHVIIILEGSAFLSRTGPSPLVAYPCIDFVIQGDGEQPLSALRACVTAWGRKCGGARRQHAHGVGRWPGAPFPCAA